MFAGAAKTRRPHKAGVAQGSFSEGNCPTPHYGVGPRTPTGSPVLAALERVRRRARALGLAPAVPARAPGQREGRVRAVPELVPVVGGLSAG